MIDDKESLFSVAPRATGTITVDGNDVAVVEMAVRDRIDFVDFAKECDNNMDLSYAFLVSRCCPALKDATVDEIVDRLNPAVLAELGAKVLELSGADEKKP